MSESASLIVNGMKCGGCESAVKEKLMALEGVNLVTADHKDGKVDVEFESEKVNLNAIIDAILVAGYSVE